VIIDKECAASNNGTYYTIVNTDLREGNHNIHVHTSHKSEVHRIRRCYKEIQKYGFTRERDISIRNRALKLMGYNVVV
jgi:uncharacterized protein YbcC (UPF0753/DUF2309 family)